MAFDLKNKAVRRLRLPTVDYSGATPQFIYAQRGDIRSRFVMITLYDDRGDIHLDSDSYCAKLETRSLDTEDSVYVETDAEISTENGAIICEIGGNAFQTVGKAVCNLVVCSNDENESDKTYLTSRDFYVITKETGYLEGLNTERVDNDDRLVNPVQAIVILRDDVDDLMKIPLDVGENESSIIMNTSTAGQKAFYIYQLAESASVNGAAGYYRIQASELEISFLSQGDIFSLKIGGNYENVGRIISIQKSTDTGYYDVYVDVFEWGKYVSQGNSLIDASNNRAEFWISGKPEVGNVTIGLYSTALGHQTKATQFGAHSEGVATHAYGKYAHAEGFGTEAGYAAHAEGISTKAVGLRSHSEGNRTVAAGEASHSEGYITQSGLYGYYIEYIDTTNKKIYLTTTNPLLLSTSVPKKNGALMSKYTAGMTYSIKFNNTYQDCGTITQVENNIITVDSIPGLPTKDETSYNHEFFVISNNSELGGVILSSSNYAHAEGNYTKAIGTSAHAEGYNTVASGTRSHAEGQTTSASGIASHAEGVNSKAVGRYAHAEGGISHNDALAGMQHVAKGNYSHAEGYANCAEGEASHAEGGMTHAKGKYSHAGGSHTIANGESETAIGTYNKEVKNALLSVGNGTESKRSNAFVVMKDGRVTIGALPVSDMDAAPKAYVDDIRSNVIRNYNSKTEYVEGDIVSHKGILYKKNDFYGGEDPDQEDQTTWDRVDNYVSGEAIKEYNPNITYENGDIVSYEGKLYKCTDSMNPNAPDADDSGWVRVDSYASLEDINEIDAKISDTSSRLDWEVTRLENSIEGIYSVLEGVEEELWQINEGGVE